MSVLQLGADSSLLAHAAAATVLFLHIGAGGIGLVSGAAALALRKGSVWHGRAGRVFVAAMLTMSAIGASVAPFLPAPERASVVAGVLTFYLVLTSWVTVCDKSGSGGRLFDVGALLVALCVTGTGALFIRMASLSPTGTLDGQPRQAFYLFVLVGSLALAGDVRLVWQGGVTGAQRIARHLWRMCVALFIAAASLFLGQQQVFPAALRGSAWLFVPELVIVLLLLFWLGRVLLAPMLRRARA
ncbi:MAG: hypothetical protein V4463_10510 [Pseudomonadota bacterium]